MELEQYEIVLVNLDPTVGSEIKKTRPCVIISPDEMNKYLKTIVVASMTSNTRNYPSRVEIKHNGKLGRVVLDQVRTIDRKRIVKKLGICSGLELREIKLKMKEIFVD